jgi:predicted Zn-dependent protease
MYSDGVYIKENKPSMTLVNFGGVSSHILGVLKHSLMNFLSSLDMDNLPEITLLKYDNPSITVKGDEEMVFKQELREVPGNIVMGVTNQGIYDRYIDRYIFGFGIRGRGLLSTYRFIKPPKNHQKDFDRLSKEIIKIFGLAVGIPHCYRTDCILTYHRSVTDLDTNVGVCENCREDFKIAVNRLIQD